MLQSMLLSQATPSAPALVQPSASTCTLEVRGALHDLNNLLLIMATYTSLAINQLPVDSPAYGPVKQAEEAVSQAAQLSYELQTALKLGAHETINPSALPVRSFFSIPLALCQA